MAVEGGVEREARRSRLLPPFACWSVGQPAGRRVRRWKGCEAEDPPRPRFLSLPVRPTFSAVNFSRWRRS